MTTNERISYTFYEAPWCDLMVASNSSGVCLVQFGRSLARAQLSLDGLWAPTAWVESKRANREVLEQLRSYFRGQRRRFALPLDLRGTPFQLQVWRALRRIPFGHTWSYKQLAQTVGRLRAVRAVGMACHANRLALVVPCHRVVGADGSLTGFGGGLALKQRLLEWEAGFR